MPRHKPSKALPPPPEPAEGKADYAALARAEKADRADKATRAVLEAVKPILALYQVRLAVRQTYLDGQPGPIEIICITAD